MIHRTLRGLVSATALLACLAAGAAPDVSDYAKHDLEVRLDPATHGIVAEDAIVLPAAALAEGRLRFLLHGALTVECPAPECGLEPQEGIPDRTRYGINEEGSGQPDVPLREYVVRPGPRVLAGEDPLRLTYRGEIFHPLVAEGAEYARSFSRSPGIIDSEGVVLSGSSWWLPVFDDGLVTFRLTVDLPQEWDAVSQGARTLHESAAGRRRVSWDSPHPMDEVYLIAARFIEYSRPAGEATAYAFLREPDPNLAAKYLEATAQYLEMYRKLIGPYPYGKFALIENFWETGYGMPSFTLLGPRIIRFPFILHSSYPHEILHNWWGNSVFVDYATGNWCEGLTAYLADHLVKEGQGQGAEYRRDALKKYRNFVRDAQDFPLTDFRSRHSSATEAVGYGKSLMLWHMLRRQLGDETFAEGLRRFYRDNAFRRAGFGDLETAFSGVAGEDLAPLFRQWVERSGAPQLRIEELSTAQDAEGDVQLTLVLKQLQVGEPYRLSVPVAVTLEGEPAARMHLLDMDGARGTLKLQLPARPLRVDVDPEFDLFRRLDPFEIPPSLGQLFGAEQVTLVLPDSADPLTPADWEGFAERWTGQNGEQLQVVRESELQALPTDRAVWILGRDNRWAGVVASALDGFGAGVDGNGIRTGETELPLAEHSFAFAVRHPDDPDLALGWIGADRSDALEGLARKLPHYGKYSFVAFEGAEPTNVAKGQWPVLGSPLVRFPGPEPVAMVAPPAREPLARLEPVFDPEALMSHVRRLAAPELEGRGVGTAGLDNAGNYVARFFEQAGLTPGGEDGGWFQSWTEPGGPDAESVTLRNVIGVLPGTRPEWAGQSVIIGAHYDHLGDGWPDVHAGDEGKTHPGADDNASGVAVLLELARLLGDQLEPPRTVVFVAFSGEEWGLRGSRHYVGHEERWPVSKAMGMINLDTVGRLEGKPITVFGTGTATEWVHIVRGIGFTTGVQGRAVADDPGGSDQKSFHEAGLPAVQLFSGAHADYHRPGDTPDRIDADGMIDVAVFAREALVYLSEREEPLTSTLSAGSASPATTPSAPASGRRVSLGTLPDFGFPGPGVKIDQVMPGTPAEAAGLLAGDLIVSIDGKPIDGLRTYAGVLREHAPGDLIRITISRDGVEQIVEATLVAR